MANTASSLITTENTEGTENNALEYYHLGEIQINGALDMYENKNFICALSLAGTANTLLYSLIEELKKAHPTKYSNALTTLKKVLSDTYGIQETDLPDLSLPRNSLKHYIEESCDKEWDIKSWAETEICCAIYNLLELIEKISPRMSSFISAINRSLPNNTDINLLSGQVIDCAIQVHRQLGPGLLESAYQQALAYLFSSRHIPFEKEKIIPVRMGELLIEAGYRAGFVVGGQIILEIKSIDKLAPIHDAQLLTYMKLGSYPLGILLNFNERLLKDGIKRMKL